MKKFVPYFLLLFSIINCSSASNSEENFMSKSSMSSPEMAVMRDSGRTSISELSQSNIDKKIQKNANLSIEVKDIEKSLDKAKQIISTFNGEIISTSSGGMDFGQPYANIRLRVPSEKLNDAVEALKKISSKILSENIYTNDVTEEFIDIEAKLNIMKSTEKRFNDLLNEAKNVEEVIQVEKELMRIRGEIDSLQGRIKYLTTTTDNSQLNIYMIEEMPISGGDDWNINDSFDDSLRNFVSFTKSMADFLIGIIVFMPILIILGLGTFFGYRFIKKKRSN